MFLGREMAALDDDGRCGPDYLTHHAHGRKGRRAGIVGQRPALDTKLEAAEVPLGDNLVDIALDARIRDQLHGRGIEAETRQRRAAWPHEAPPPVPAHDSDIVIETRNLTKVYRDFWGRQKVRALKALDSLPSALDGS